MEAKRALENTPTLLRGNGTVELELEDSSIYTVPHAFINKKGEAVLIERLEERLHPYLIEMYIAYRPRASFQGLPPLDDVVCEKWVRDMVEKGTNLVALSFERGVVGHAALFPMNECSCEVVTVVRREFQNIGIGTELVRCSVHLSHEMGFGEIWLSVEATNPRARHVYRKCGFEYVTEGGSGELGMAADLKRYRETVKGCVGTIMNKNVITIRPDQPCRQALQLFLTKHVASLPVIDENRQLLGALFKTDLLFPSKIDKTVEEVLTKQVYTVREECPIADVVRMFQSKTICCVPVLDRDRKLIGIVGREDVLAYYATHHGQQPN